MPFIQHSEDRSIAIHLVNRDTLPAWLEQASEPSRKWIEANGYKAAAGETCLVPNKEGGLEAVLVGEREGGPLWQLAGLPADLPSGRYALSADFSAEEQVQAALGWGLGCYRFERYRKTERSDPKLVLDEAIEAQAKPLLAAQLLVRDLVNTPTEDLGPEALCDALRAAGKPHGADYSVVSGEALLEQNYPAIHTVGRAAERRPALARLDWGDEEHPLLILVGKGVCFDTGGLNIKPGGSMALMKKDMGGAAHVIALAQLIMQAALPVRLLVLVPAVENNIAGNAYRPGDVIGTRAGKSIEIGNTDAEGRLVLCDALTLAMELSPDLVIDFATLTGAARVALGPDLPPVFSNDASVARGLVEAGDAVEDPLWELPLHQRYLEMLKSEIADLNNAGKGGFAGAITAALFLEQFVESNTPWAHIDTFAWMPAALPGRPVGGEALGLRAAFTYLQTRYAG